METEVKTKKCYSCVKDISDPMCITLGVNDLSRSKNTGTIYFHGECFKLVGGDEWLEAMLSAMDSEGTYSDYHKL